MPPEDASSLGKKERGVAIEDLAGRIQQFQEKNYAKYGRSVARRGLGHLRSHPRRVSAVARVRSAARHLDGDRTWDDGCLALARTPPTNV